MQCFIKKLAILLSICLLAACAPATAQPTPRPTVTVTASPTTTSPTQIITPTNIPAVEPTPSTNIPAQYQLPDWINDPQANVAVMITDVKDHIYTLSFLNVVTRDSFDISLSPNLIRGYFWMPDGKLFGFLASDLKTIFLVNLGNGNVDQHPISEKTVRLLSAEKIGIIEPLIAHGSLEQDDFHLVSSHQSDFSANFKYRAKMDYESAASPFLIVENLESGSITPITTPSDRMGGYQFAWSPKVSYLEFLQGTDGTAGMTPTGQKITIYKPDGQKVTSFEGDFRSPKWSPDGSKILYEEPASNSPCILEINTGVKKCIREIGRNHSELSYTGSFSWSQNEKQIYYTYHSDQDEIKSGFCVYNLLSGINFCPTTNVPELKTANVEWYNVSPNEQFLVFSAGSSCAGCDFWGEPSSIMIGMDGKNSYSLGEEILVTDLYTFSYPMATLLWRPIITPEP